MGAMRFQVTSLAVLPQHLAERSYLVSLDGIPWISHNAVDEDQLVLDRDTHESARLVVPWHVPGFGEYLLQTATLVERERPYLLPLELARGTLCQIRDYVADEPPPTPSTFTDLAHLLHEASQAFVLAATAARQPELAARLADRCLHGCLRWIDAFATQQKAGSQTLAQRQSGELSTVLGVTIDDQASEQVWEDLPTAFNVIFSTSLWRHLERQPGERSWDSLDRHAAAVEKLGLDWGVGPILSWTREALPDWMSLWEQDFDALHSHMVQQVQAVVQRYRGRPRFWHVVHRVNTATGLPLNEQQRLELAAAAVDAAVQIDRQTPVLVSFENPWFDYLARHRYEATPLDYGEALVRAKLGLSAIGLEINLGYWPHGIGRRTALDVEQMISWWARLGLPLILFLAAPSDTARDTAARLHVQPITLGIDQPNPQAQADLVEQWYSCLLVQPSVAGIVWKQFSDQLPHELPHAGLLGVDGQPKPICQSLQSIRQRYAPD